MNITSDYLKLVHCLEEDSYNYSELEEILGERKHNLRHGIANIGKCLDIENLTPEILNQRLIINSHIKELLRSYQTLTNEERRLYLALQFLEKEVINLSEISRELDVTRRTITNDLKILRESLRGRGLEIESLNSMGIILGGDSKIREDYFFEILMKAFMERDYLPLIFEKFFIQFENFKEKYRIDEVLEEVISAGSVVVNSFTLMTLESWIYIYMIKDKKGFPKDYSEAIKLADEKGDDVKILMKILDNYSYFDDDKKNFIIGYCIKNCNRNIRLYYENEIRVVEEMADFISKNTSRKVTLEGNAIIPFVMRYIIVHFKKMIGVAEFYPINKEITKENFEEYLQLKEIFGKYYESLDSFDVIALYMNILKSSEERDPKKLKKISEKKENDEIIIIYKYFSKQLISKLKEDLEIALEKKIQDCIQYKFLESYLKKNSVTTIITFEDIKMRDEKKYNLIRYRLPLTKLNISNLKEHIH